MAHNDEVNPGGLSGPGQTGEPSGRQADQTGKPSGKRYHGAICEDDAQSLLYIERVLERAFSERNVPMRLDVYSRPEQLYHAIERGTRYDVLFLDIDMPRLNGIELTRNARALGVQSAVVFISNKEEMVFQTFAVQPLYFLRKSHFLDGLPHMVRAVEQELHRHERTVVTIEELHSDHVYSFDIQQLIYVEAMGKQCQFVTPLGRTRIQCRLATLVEQLRPVGFVQCHRSYLVNCRFVFSLSRDSLTLDNRETLPIGRSHHQSVKEAFMAFVHGGGNA